MGKIINVIMPSYNCGKFLDHSVLSVFSQITKHKIILLISNDYSTDNTVEVLSRLQNTLIRDNFEIISTGSIIPDTNILLANSSGGKSYIFAKA